MHYFTAKMLLSLVLVCACVALPQQQRVQPRVGRGNVQIGRQPPPNNNAPPQNLPPLPGLPPPAPPMQKELAEALNMGKALTSPNLIRTDGVITLTPGEPGLHRFTCYAKRELPILKKESGPCGGAGIGPKSICDGQGDPLRAFRSVLSYAVAHAIGSKVIQKTRPVKYQNKLVASCMAVPPNGAVQPRRLGRFKQTFIMEFSRVQTSDGTTKFAVFKRTDTVPSDNELQTASPDDAIIPSQSRPDRGAFIKGAGKLPSHMYACLKTIVQTGFETTEFDPVKGENFGFLRQADCVPCGVFSPKKLTGPDAFAYAQGLKRGFVWLEYFDPGAQTKDALDELQLLDHVALQCDRHQENYFVQGSNVFGIDLDMSWGNLGYASNPYPKTTACKIPDAVPSGVSPAVVARIAKLENGVLGRIIDAIGADMNVNQQILTAIKTNALARLTRVMSDLRSNPQGPRTTKTSYLTHDQALASAAAKCDYRPGVRVGRSGAVSGADAPRPLPRVVPPNNQNQNVDPPLPPNRARSSGTLSQGQSGQGGRKRADTM